MPTKRRKVNFHYYQFNLCSIIWNTIHFPLFELFDETGKIYNDFFFANTETMLFLEHKY